MRKNGLVAFFVLAAVAIMFCPLRVLAESDQKEAETNLAEQTQNPVAKLISVPFQNNFNFGIGPNNVTQWVLNVQPVIPISLGPDWNLITRTIIPIINQPSPAPGIHSAFGLGDINPTLFLSPAGSSEFIWGVGPTFTLPTATDSMLGSGKWSAGPAAVALTMQQPWVVGVPANTQWSFAGWSDKYVTQTLVQPFVNYNFEKGLYLVSSPIITCNWEADGGNRWTVPLGGGVGKIFHVGKLPINNPTPGVLQRGHTGQRPGLAAPLPSPVAVPEVIIGLICCRETHENVTQAAF